MSGDLTTLGLSDSAQVGVATEHLSRIGGNDTVDVSGTVLSMRVPSASTELPRLLRSLDAAGVIIDTIEVRRPTLDDVFLTMTGRSTVLTVQNVEAQNAFNAAVKVHNGIVNDANDAVQAGSITYKDSMSFADRDKERAALKLDVEVLNNLVPSGSNDRGST